MRDYIEIGATPAGEECAQVGQEGYQARANRECRRFIDVIRAELGPEPEGASLKVKSNPHDFGTYYEVVCWFEEGNQQAEDYAFRCEAEAPEYWV